jgi:hypothetical protein
MTGSCCLAPLEIVHHGMLFQLEAQAREGGCDEPNMPVG